MTFVIPLSESPAWVQASVRAYAGDRPVRPDVKVHVVEKVHLGGSEGELHVYHNAATGETRTLRGGYSESMISEGPAQQALAFGMDVPLHPGQAYLCISRYYDGGTRYSASLYIHPADAPKELSAPSADLSEDEKILLVCTVAYKSSYAGIRDMRAHEARRQGMKGDPDVIRASLRSRGLLDARNAITTKGRNVVVGLRGYEQNPVGMDDPSMSWDDIDRSLGIEKWWVSPLGKVIRVWRHNDDSILDEIPELRVKYPKYEGHVDLVVIDEAINRGWVRVHKGSYGYGRGYRLGFFVEGHSNSIRNLWGVIVDIALESKVQGIYAEDYGSKRTADMSMDEAFEGPPRFSIMERNPLPYGYWIAPDGSVVPVQEYQDHERVIVKLTGKTPHGAYGAIDNGWLRILYDDGEYFAEGTRPAIHRQWNKIVNIAMDYGSRKINVEIAESSGHRSYREISIEEAFEGPPAIIPMTNQNPRVRWSFRGKRGSAWFQSPRRAKAFAWELKRGGPRGGRPYSGVRVTPNPGQPGCPDCIYTSHPCSECGVVACTRHCDCRTAPLCTCGSPISDVMGTWYCGGGCDMPASRCLCIGRVSYARNPRQGLPSRVFIPPQIADAHFAGDDVAVADYLSDMYGCLVKGLEVRRGRGYTEAVKIVWDMR